MISDVCSISSFFSVLLPMSFSISTLPSSLTFPTWSFLIAFRSAALGTGWVMLGLSLKCNMFRICFFTASTISGWKLGTFLERVPRAQDGQSETKLCPSDPEVGELCSIIQQNNSINPLVRSKGILAAKVVVIPFLKRQGFSSATITSSPSWIFSPLLPLFSSGRTKSFLWSLVWKIPLWIH